ncbi:MAG: hypothetical protein ACKVU1_13425 [bacterium]
MPRLRVVTLLVAWLCCVAEPARAFGLEERNDEEAVAASEADSTSFEWLVRNHPDIAIAQLRDDIRKSQRKPLIVTGLAAIVTGVGLIKLPRSTTVADGFGVAAILIGTYSLVEAVFSGGEPSEREASQRAPRGVH